MNVLGKLGIGVLTALIALQLAASELVEDSAARSQGDFSETCLPLCLETDVSDKLAIVWMVDDAGNRAFLFQYEPDWSSDQTSRPTAPEHSHSFYVPRDQEGLAKVAETDPCGPDGWGYTLGQEVFAATMPGRVMVTGTYIGSGQQLVIHDKKGSPTKVAILPTIAARTGTGCEAARASVQAQ